MKIVLENKNITVFPDLPLNLGMIKEISVYKNKIKILPEEIDLLLEGHPAVMEACAFGVADAISGETVAAAVCVKEGENIDVADLRAWCAERIRPDGVPEKWYIVDEIPKTDRGKVNRQQVHDYCIDNG